MNRLEKLLDSVATSLIMLDVEDLPGLAGVHEGFLQISREAGDDAGIIRQAAEKSAEFVEKIVLNEVPDKAAVISMLNNGIGGMQAIVRDGRSPAEVIFPPELGLSNVAAGSSAKAGQANRDDRAEASSGAGASVTPQKSPGGVAKAAPVSSGQTLEPLIVSLENSDSSLLAEFINEAREHCSIAEQMLMDLETGPDNESAINAIFRGFHTIKGAAGFLDLKPVSVLAHESETLLDLARKGSVQIVGPVADMIFDAIDVMRKLLDGTEKALAGNGQFEATDLVAPILTALRQFLENPCEAPSGIVPKRVGDILVEMGVITQPEIDSALALKESPEEKLGETLVKQGALPAKVVAQALRSQQQGKAEKPSATVKEMVKIDTERLDRLVDTIGELVIAESMVGQDEEILRRASPKVARNITHLNKITREIQEMGMAMRLVPVKPTFQKLARAIRDLTKKSGKEIEFIVSGEDTEVDRSIAEHIGDPLMHMVRNSADHGLESPEDRVKAGKNRTGTITVRAYHKGGNIFFDIEDDGKGLDRERIVAKAREKGLIEHNKEITDKEIFNLILLPGFSTAQKVTDISGRGVGMDVVKKNIDSMRGSLEISSTPGKGTLFSIKLPLTLAIIDGMLVKVEHEKLIIPTLSIVESLSLTRDMIFTVTGKGEMINLRGELLPLIRIRELFEFEKEKTTNDSKAVVVVEDGTKRVGLVVNELLGQRQTVIKSLGPVFGKQKWIAGGAILSDGAVGLIMDVSGVIGLSSSSPMVEREAFEPEEVAVS